MNPSLVWTRISPALSCFVSLVPSETSLTVEVSLCVVPSPSSAYTASGVAPSANTNANKHERTPLIFGFLFIAFQAQAPNPS